MTDLQTWSEAALAELSGQEATGGGWGYSTGPEPNTEATALCLLALFGWGAEASSTAGGADFLRKRRLADGSFSLSAVVGESTWATPLAAMALGRAGDVDAPESAVQWLLNAPVLTVTPTPAIYGYNTGLAGWSWTAGDYSFVEPTAVSLLLLKQQGQGQQPRAREAVALLSDRSLPAGGWNYGESVVLGNTLLPAIVPTALTLVAMADEPGDMTEAALNWLLAQQGTITSLFSLGWAAIALNLWGVLAPNWVSDVMARWEACPSHRRSAMNTALCLLGLSSTQGHPLAM